MIPLDHQRVAGQSDNSLDQIVPAPGADADGLQDRADHHLGNRLLNVRLGRIAEDNNVASLGLVPIERELVDHHPIVHLDCGEHRFGWDPEGLNEKGLDDDGDDEGRQQQTGELRPK